MPKDNKFGILRRILRALGLSRESSDDAVEFVANLLDGENENHEKIHSASSNEFPYLMRDQFLSPAELAFYRVLRRITKGKLVVLSKINLNDIFYVKRDNASHYRTYTNKIDRKHVDYLLCRPDNMQPILGIELDDKSHQREDRKKRDAFVDGVLDYL